MLLWPSLRWIWLDLGAVLLHGVGEGVAQLVVLRRRVAVTGWPGKGLLIDKSESRL